LKLLSDEALARKFGENARAQAIARYDANTIISQYIAFYEKIVSQSQKRQQQTA